MVRRAAAIMGLVLTLCGLVLVTAPADAADPGPVIAGTFTGRLNMTRTNPDIQTKSGPRTLTFGQGCATSTGCTFTRTSAGATAQQQLEPQGGSGFGWSGRQVLPCYDDATGAMSAAHGAIDTYSVRMRPAATTSRGGRTYVTAITGTYREDIQITGAGVAANCTTMDGGRRASAQGTYAFTLVPLATPKDLTTSPPIALPPAATRVTTGTLPGFHLPQSKDQRDSARAVLDGTRSSVPGALITPTEAVKSIGSRLPQDLLLVAVLGLLIIFPAQLFNSTYEQNHERIDRRLSRLRFWRRRPSVSTSTVGAVPAQAPAPDTPEPVTVAPSRGRRLAIFFGCLVVGTLLAGVLDPGFGADAASYALVTGIFLSVLVTVAVVVLAGRVYRSASRHETDWYLEAIPSALLVAALCVLVSRLTHFEPGYLYGVLGGAVFIAALDRRSEGRSEVTVAVVALVLALGSWIAFEPVSHAASSTGASYPVLALDSLLASLFIGGLEGMLFGLIPLRFLPGARIKNWSWIAWGVLMVVVTYVFVHVLLMPESGYLGRSTSASVTTTIALFAAFALVSALFWGYFRWRPTADEPTEKVIAEVGSEPLPSTEPAEVPEREHARVSVDSTGDQS